MRGVLRVATPVALTLLVAALGMRWHALSDPTSSTAAVDGVSRLVHWQDAGHDWLLVADRASHELVVYDARTGAPLQRLGADDGLGEVDAIAQAGDRLLVHGGIGPTRVLALPELRAVALAAR